MFNYPRPSLDTYLRPPRTLNLLVRKASLINVSLGQHITFRQDLCSLAYTSKYYHESLMPLATRNIQLKDLTRIHALALHVERAPEVFAACRSLEIGNFTGIWLKAAKLLEEMCNLQFLQLSFEYRRKELGIAQHLEDFLQDHAFRDILHQDLVTVLRSFTLRKEQSRLPANDSPYLRKFSWAGRKDEPMVQSNDIAEALSQLSVDLDTLHLTIQSWEFSFWTPLFLNSSCIGLKSLHLFILDQNLALPFNETQALGAFIIQQSMLVDLRLKLPHQTHLQALGLSGTYPNLQSFELDCDADVRSSSFLSRHPSLLRVSLQNQARTLPVTATDVLRIRALWLDHTQRRDYESIRPWFQACPDPSVAQDKSEREIVQLRTNVDTEIEHSALVDFAPIIGHSLRCLELVLDRTHFRWSLRQLETVMHALPLLTELGFVWHSRRQPWHEWLSVNDLICVLETTKDSPCLLGLRFSDEGAYPLPSPVIENLGQVVAPCLKHIRWEIGKNSQLYQILRANVQVSAKEMDNISFRNSEAGALIDWTSDSLFDHVNGFHRYNDK